MSVTDLLHAAGLIHAGFYRHQESKDSQVAEAVQSIHDTLVKGPETKVDKADEAVAFEDDVAKYFLQGHFANPDVGRPTAASAPRVRQPRFEGRLIMGREERSTSLVGIKAAFRSLIHVLQDARNSFGT